MLAVQLVAMQLGAAASTEPQAVAQSAYVSCFTSGVQALDAGQWLRAAGAFESAGEAAPDAPVWRVHAAFSRLRAGDVVAARALARAALERGYPLTDLAAIAAELVPDADHTGRQAGDTATTRPATTGVPVALGGPISTPTAPGLPQRLRAPGPSKRKGPSVTSVWIRPTDDAAFVRFGAGWIRLELARLELRTGDDPVERPVGDPWSEPRMQPPDTELRDRIVALAGAEGGPEQVPIVSSPSGDAWLYFQTAGGLSPGSPADVLAVVDAKATRVIARLGTPTDFGMGPYSLWPPYFSPGGSVLAVSGWWGASLHVFDTRDWSRRWDVPSRVDKGTSGGCDLQIPNERRLYAMDECELNSHLCECYDLASGEVLFRGKDAGLMQMAGSSDDIVVIARSTVRPNAVTLLDGRDFTHLCDVWVVASQGEFVTAAHAVDGTFDHVAPGPSELAVVGTVGRFVSQHDAAPWLLDPLHVRSIRMDTDRAPRLVPEVLVVARAVENPR